MNQKRTLIRILAAVLAVCTLTSCRIRPSDGAQTSQTTESAPQTQNPNAPARDFAERLQSALQNEDRADLRFEIREKHAYQPSSIMERTLFAKWQSDFSNKAHPRFSFSMQRNPKAEEPEIRLFYDEGFLYVKDSLSRYRQPASLGQAKDKIPFDGLTALLGGGFAEALETALLTENADGTVTAEIGISLIRGAEAFTEYLKLFGIEASGYAYGMDGDPCQITVTVCMDGERLLAYRMETIMAGQDANREIYPVTYTVEAVYHALTADFVPEMPDAAARADYAEAEPEITEIDAQAFLKRFEKSDARSEAAVYTEMITNSTVTYEFPEGHWVKIPILNVTAVDLSDPRAPKVSVVESKWDAMGIARKKETYYTDDTYYYADGDRRFSMPYPAEEYLANVEAAAKEKEEAGITTFFLTAEMLEKAVLTVNPDQSVTASMQFDGASQKNNIFYHILSIYNDDLAAMPNAEIFEASLTVTLDRFNYLTSYTLTVTAAVESGATKALATYAAQYGMRYSETPREIDFPSDLEEWGNAVDRVTA